MYHASNMIFIIILALGGVLIQGSFALTAYDCQSAATNITAFATTNIQDCAMPRLEEQNNTITNALVIQKEDLIPIQVLQCRLNIVQVITRCGHMGHTSEVVGGHSRFLYEFTKSQCEDPLRTNLFVYPYKTHAQAQTYVNSVNEGTYYIAGWSDTKGDCGGAGYTFRQTWYEQALVSHNWELYYTTLTGKLDVITKKIHIRDISCDYDKLQCKDAILGQLFWDKLHDLQCDKKLYNILYKGPATKFQLTDQTTNAQYSILTIRNSVYIFSILLKESSYKCNIPLTTTDQFNIFVSFDTENSFFQQTQASTPSNSTPSLIAYLNTKLLYLDHHIGSQLVNLYSDLLHRQCRQKQASLRNLLTLSKIDPEGFAYALTNEPGYSSMMMGEVVYVLKCSTVNVTFRTVPKCYQEIPVTYLDKPAFVTPRNRLITYHANEVICSPLYPVIYNLSKTWTIMNQSPSSTLQPTILNPNEPPTWKFNYTLHIGTAGLYSQEHLEAYTRQMLFVNERSAINNIIAQTLYNPNTDRQGLHFNNLIDEEKIKQKIETFFSNLLTSFQTFGIWVSTVIGIVTVVKCLIYFIEVLINGAHLYHVFGWSFKLLAAIFQSATTYLLLIFAPRNRQSYDILPNPPDLPPRPDHTDLLATAPIYPRLPSTSTTTRQNEAITYVEMSPLTPNTAEQNQRTDRNDTSL